MSTPSFPNLRVALGALLFLGGCDNLITGGTEGGRFSVHFTWEGERPLHDDVLYVLGVVRREGNGESPSRVTEAGPVRYQPGVSLAFGNVPPGDGYVVVVEFRESPSLDATVRRYGISRPFSLHPGDDRVVEVRVHVRHTPSTRDGFALVADVAAGRPHPRATVDLLVSGAEGTRVVLSNAVDMSCGAAEGDRCSFALGASPSEPSGVDGTWRVRDWPLAGLGDPAACASCTRTVYARFVDAEGYPSDVLGTDITLDLVPPRLSWVTNAGDGVLGLGATLVLALQAEEPVTWTNGDLQPGTSTSWTRRDCG